jgi:hypothetical protein
MDMRLRTEQIPLGRECVCARAQRSLV